MFKKTKCIALIGLALASMGAIASDPKQDKVIDFKLKFGPWSKGPTQVGWRSMYLALGDVTVAECVQINVTHKGKIAIDNSDCTFTKINEKGFMVIDEDKALAALYEDSGLAPRDDRPWTLWDSDTW